MRHENLLGYEGAAARLGMEVATLRTLVHRKSVPHIRIGPRSVRFRPEDLDRWMGGRAVPAKQPKPRHGPRASSLHEEAIGRLAPHATRDGFRPALAVHVGLAEDLNQRVVPDAYAFDDAARCLSIYEVVHTHDLTARKFGSLRALRDRMTQAGWSLRLFAASVHDRNMTEVDVDTEEPTAAEMRANAHRVGFEMP